MPLLFKHSIFEDVSSLTRQVNLFHPHRNFCAMRSFDSLFWWISGCWQQKDKVSNDDSQNTAYGVTDPKLKLSWLDPRQSLQLRSWQMHYQVGFCYFACFCGFFPRQFLAAHGVSTDHVEWWCEGDARLSRRFPSLLLGSRKVHSQKYLNFIDEFIENCTWCQDCLAIITKTLRNSLKLNF